jgi:hypothetical protein
MLRGDEIACPVEVWCGKHNGLLLRCSPAHIPPVPAPWACRDRGLCFCGLVTARTRLPRRPCASLDSAVGAPPPRLCGAGSARFSRDRLAASA